MTRTRVFSSATLVGFLVGACAFEGAEQIASDESVAEAQAELYARSSSIWPNPHIQVCWETPGYAAQKALVRDAIRATWELESNVAFEGTLGNQTTPDWYDCNSNTTSGIRIQILDDPAGPRSGYGNELDKVPNGMVLNFGFTNWLNALKAHGDPLYPKVKDCAGTDRDRCIRATAVHEFGHAVGFYHEQLRPDSPASCRDTSPSPSGEIVSRWDPASVMNYCNPNYPTEKLSPTDVAGVQRYYGGPRSISATSWGLYRQDAFVRGTDQQVHDHWWLGWDLLGGTLPDPRVPSGNGVFGSPKFVSDTPNRFFGYARGLDGGGLYHWVGGTTWMNLGGVIVGNPAPVSWGPNRVDVFVRGTDDALHHYNAGYSSLGGEVTGEISATSPGVNRLDVFYRGKDGALWHHFGNGSSWASESLGGVLTSSPSAVSVGPNKLDVFVRGTDYAIWHRSCSGICTGANWGPWQSLGGQVTGNPSAVAWWKPIGGGGARAERLDIFARGVNGQLLRSYWDGSNWYTMQDLGGVLRGSPTAVATPPNRVDVFTRGADDALHSRYLDVPLGDSAWSIDQNWGGKFY